MNSTTPNHGVSNNYFSCKMIILVLFLPKFLLEISGVPNWLRHVASISSPIAFAQGFEALADAEAEQTAVGVDNWHGGTGTKYVYNYDDVRSLTRANQLRFGYGYAVLHLVIDIIL